MVFGLKSKDRKTNDFENNKYNKRVFGAPLNVAVQNGAVSSSVQVPKIVWECVSHVNEHGLIVEGIYRISASKARLDELEKSADLGNHIEFTDVHNAAGLLKRFLRQLPSHVLGVIRKDAEEAANGCQCSFDSPCRCNAVIQVSNLLKQLPIENYHLLCIVFIHSQYVVQNSNVNKMNFAALGVLLQAMLNMPKQLIRLFLLNATSKFISDGEPITELFNDPVITRLFDGESSSQVADSADDVRHQNVEPSPTFLEKQLLALHISLKLEVDEEKRKVTQLLGVLRQVRSALPEDALKAFDATHCKSQLPDLQTPTDPVNPDDLTEMERKRDELLAEIVKYRDLCGLLRARLEQYNLLLSSAQKDGAVAQNDASESVVTRF